jgi:hypothetical protein
VNINLAEPGDERTLALSMGYARIDEGYFSALNPNLITGEEGVRLGLASYARDWDWSLEGAVARTNIGGSAANPEDRLGRLSFDISDAPEVFTGGFMNGASFFFGAEMLRQDRINTPAGAIAPQDNTIWQLSLGFNRYQPDHSLALLYTYDHFDDRTGANEDERIHGFKAFVTVRPDDRFNASALVGLKMNDGVTGRYWTATGSVALGYDIIPDRLNYAVKVGFERSDRSSVQEGGFVGNELAWNFSRQHALVLSADYGRGSMAQDLAGGSGWVFGLALRSEFSQARYR